MSHDEDEQERLYEVHVTFPVTVSARDADSAVDAAYAMLADEFAQQIKDGGLDPFDISWKDAHLVENPLPAVRRAASAGSSEEAEVFDASSIEADPMSYQRKEGLRGQDS